MKYSNMQEVNMRLTRVERDEVEFEGVALLGVEDDLIYPLDHGNWPEYGEDDEQSPGVFLVEDYLMEVLDGTV